MHSEVLDIMALEAVSTGKISLTVANNPDGIVLKNADGNEVDQVDFDDGGEWPTEPDGNGYSLELCDPFKDNALGRESYLKYLEAKGAKTGGSYHELERGWCLGDGDFKQKMLDKVETMVTKNKRESNSGSIQRDHSEGEAGKLMIEALERLGMNVKHLPEMSKSALEKKAIAALLSSNTLASTEWIAEQLHMGHRSSVSQAKKWARESKEGQKWLGKLVP